MDRDKNTTLGVLAQILTLKKTEKNVITPPAGEIAAERN
jgi:hypothetical protein